MRERVTESIYIDREAYMFLDRESRRQRGCKKLSKEGEDNLWKRVTGIKCLMRNGKKRVDDNSFGGGDGTYYGKWWSWSIPTIKAMLDKAGFAYEIGEEVRYINL